jgi:hypothetical protein
MAYAAPDGGEVDEPAPITVVGALEFDALQAAIEPHMSRIRYCYTRELSVDATLRGSVVIRFKIAPDGNVAWAETDSTSLGQPAIEVCIEGQVEQIQFPSPSGGGHAIVKYPFVFGSGEPVDVMRKTPSPPTPPPRPPAVKLTLEQSVERVLRSQRDALLGCTTGSASDSGGGAGNILVRFMVLGDGSVPWARTESGSAFMQECLRAGITQLSFPLVRENVVFSATWEDLRAESGASVRIEEAMPAIEGKLGSEDVIRALGRYSDELQRCNQRFFGKPHVAGEVIASVSVAPDGRVDAVELSGSTFGDPAIDECVARVFWEMQFRPTEDGKSASFRYPVWFAPPAR